MTALMSALAGANVIFGLGMLECGLTWDFGQLVLQNELVRFIKKVVEGINVSDDTLNVDLIKEVGAGGEFVSHEHTFRNMKQLSTAELTHRGSREAWNSLGSPDIIEKAYEKAIDIIENYKPKPLDKDIVTKVDEIVAEAKEHYTSGN